MTAGTIAFQSWRITVMVERGSTDLRTTLALISTRNSTSVVEQATSPSMLIMALAKVDPERIKPHEQPMVSSGQESRNLIRNAPVLLPLRPLAEHIAAEVNVHIASLPGRGARFGEKPVTQRSTLVSALADAIQQIRPHRFVLYGHSMGGILGFEITRELRRRRLTPPPSPA